MPQVPQEGERGQEERDQQPVVRDVRMGQGQMRPSPDHPGDGVQARQCPHLMSELPSAGDAGDCGSIVIPILEAGARTGASTDDPRAGIGIGFDGDPMYTLQGGKQHAVGVASTGDISHCLNAGGMGRIDYETETLVTHALTGEGFDASEDGTGRGTPLVTGFYANDSGNDASEDLCPTLRSMERGGGNSPAVAFQERGRGDGERSLDISAEVAYALTAPNGGGRRQELNVATGMAVRRLTPLECERLQGFPDSYTAVTHNGKPAADGPRYKALGNSMAVPVVSWIGNRLRMVCGE